MAEIVENIQQLLDPILGSYGLTLWDMDFQRQGPQWLLRVYIDREAGGVTLNDCESVSRDLSAALDVEDIIAQAFTLEVSSPGLDRTLSKPEHFHRFAGSTIKVKTYKPLNNQKVFRGTLLGTGADTVRLKLETGETLEIAYIDIAKASLEAEF